MAPSGRERLVASVRGSVQGVGFRWFVEREAARLGLEGWVSNQVDGSVEVVAEGDEDALRGLLLQLWEGPPGAAVRDVAIRHEPARGNLVGFTIRSGAHQGD
ncbi:MAG: acylphosphatase [Candidatus Limnocylindrales bacterium]